MAKLRVLEEETAMGDYEGNGQPRLWTDLLIRDSESGKLNMIHILTSRQSPRRGSYEVSLSNRDVESSADFGVYDRSTFASSVRASLFEQFACALQVHYDALRKFKAGEYPQLPRSFTIKRNF